MRVRHDWTWFIPLLITTFRDYMQCTRLEPPFGSQSPRVSTMTFKQITSRLHQWRRYRVSVRELSRLSDRELNDLGIGRGDIEYVARKAVRAS